MLMRVLRLGTFILTAVTAVVFAVVFVSSMIMKDRTIPEITVPDTMLEVSVKAKDEDLLRDVSAFDEKDGDISERLLVESISRFSKKGYCKITYAACDYDNHVVTASRQLHYIDYEPPKFKLNRAPVFSIYGDIDTNGLVGAVDCLDGDVSQNIIIYSPDFKEDEEGIFTIQATVSNSKGDSASINLPMVVEKIPRGAPEIKLEKYLIYLDKGADAPLWEDFIKETVDSSGIEAELQISVETNLDTEKEGVYLVNYYGTDENQITGHTALTVVVE